MKAIVQNGRVVVANGNALTYGGDTPAPTPTPTPWVRPADWPDLSKMDVSGGDILYMTSYADEGRGFCSFYITCTGSYTVEVGTISGSTFTADSTQTYTSNSNCILYYGSVSGTYKVLRVTGTAITKLTMSASSAVTIGSFYGWTANQGIIDIVGKLPSGTGLSCSTQHNLINVEIDGLVLSGSALSMFSGCNSLASVDVSSWDTSAVTSMNSMFANCNSLKSLDVSNWDTGLVTAMGSMFAQCCSLTSLDVSSWDTSKVTSMSSMFYYCASLTSLNVSDWDTGLVASMNNMFYYCVSLTLLDVSDWDTSAVTSMSSMFSNCNSLKSLDVSSWETGLVTTTGSMFSGCASLTSLNVSSWDTGAVTSMSNMFTNCYSLKLLDVSEWDTSAVKNISNIFYNCYSLQSLDVSDWDLSLVTTATNSQGVFQYCHGLHSLTLPSTMSQIGQYCFSGMRGAYEWHFKATSPPVLANTNAFSDMTNFGGKKIYVPQSALSAYQTATNWSTYASYMVGE